MIIMTLIPIGWPSNATYLLLQEPQKYSVGYQVSGSLGHLEGDKPIQTLASIYQKTNLKPFAWQHYFAGVNKSIGMRTPEIYLGKFFYLA